MNFFLGGKRPTPLQFYSSRIAVRQGQLRGTIQFNPIHHAGKLYQQYLVHAYCRVEAQRLYYLKTNQKQLRVECYTGLIDYLADAAREQNVPVGNLVILPSTFTGGPRYMREKYLDAMTIVKRFGRPVYFITFTCNPQWQEIKDVLEPYQVIHIFPLNSLNEKILFFRILATDRIFQRVYLC